jgi:hypothetical protein
MKRKYTWQQFAELPDQYQTKCRYCNRKIYFALTPSGYRPFDFVLGEYIDHKARCNIGRNKQAPIVYEAAHITNQGMAKAKE